MLVVSGILGLPLVGQKRVPSEGEVRSMLVGVCGTPLTVRGIGA